MKSIESCSAVSPSVLKNIASSATAPVVLKQQLDHWPAVQAAKQSVKQLWDYLKQFDCGQPLLFFESEARYQGRVFYDDAFSNVNFSRQTATLSSFLTAVEQYKTHVEPPSIYMGSTNVANSLPGFREQNGFFFGAEEQGVVVNSWMGNRSCISAHFDFPENFACNVAGSRTFTLFPPEQLENLYIGPLDFNPAGPPISLVNPLQPDLQLYPKYAMALQNAWQATLEPGDVLFIPSMWWHQVIATSDFNMLVNYWWKKAPGYLPSPMHALNLALLSIKSLSSEQKQAWQTLFQHYVFDDNKFEHIPEHVLGILGELDAPLARKIRGQLLNALNR